MRAAASSIFCTKTLLAAARLVAERLPQGSSVRPSVDTSVRCPVPRTEVRFGSKVPPFELVPPARFLTALTACSTGRLPGLLHPGADPGVHRVRRRAVRDRRDVSPMPCPPERSPPRQRDDASPRVPASSTFTALRRVGASSRLRSEGESVAPACRFRPAAPVALLGFPVLEHRPPEGVRLVHRHGPVPARRSVRAGVGRPRSPEGDSARPPCLESVAATRPARCPERRPCFPSKPWGGRSVRSPVARLPSVPVESSWPAPRRRVACRRAPRVVRGGPLSPRRTTSCPHVRRARPVTRGSRATSSRRPATGCLLAWKRRWARPTRFRMARRGGRPTSVVLPDHRHRARSRAVPSDRTSAWNGCERFRDRPRPQRVDLSGPT